METINNYLIVGLAGMMVGIFLVVSLLKVLLPGLMPAPPRSYYQATYPGASVRQQGAGAWIFIIVLIGIGLLVVWHKLERTSTPTNKNKSTTELIIHASNNEYPSSLAE